MVKLDEGLASPSESIPSREKRAAIRGRIASKAVLVGILSAAILGGVALGPPVAESGIPKNSHDLGAPPSPATVDAEASRPAQRADLLLGLTYNGSPNSALVTLDPLTGTITQTHLLLDPREYFNGLAYDRKHHKLWVLSQGNHNLYSIDTRTLAVKHVGNLRIDQRDDASYSGGPLAYDPRTDTLYVALEYFGYPDRTSFWTELLKVDRTTAEVELVGRIDGALVADLAFNEADHSLYGLALYGLDASESTQVLRIDPDTSSTEILFPMSYRTMIGIAFKPPSTLFSWFNSDTHFYGSIDLGDHTVTQLGESFTTIPAMVYLDFPVRAQAAPLEAAPVSFSYAGVIETVDDRAGVLGGSIVPGDRFSGEFSYDASAPWRLHNPNGHPPYGLSVSFNGNDYVIEGVNARVRNNEYYSNPREHGIADHFTLDADTDNLISVEWTLEDPSTQALQHNDRLPKQIVLSKWPVNHFVISVFDPDGHRLYTLNGKVDQIKRQHRRSGG